MSYYVIQRYMRSGEWDQAEELIRAYPDIEKKDRSLLCDALWYREVNMDTHSLVRAILETDPEQAKITDVYGEYPTPFTMQ